MKLSAEQKKELSIYRMEKAKTHLEEARSNYDHGHYNTSANRSYNAILSAARSLLILRGVDTKSHDGMKTMIAQEFVHQGYLDKNISETIRVLYARRIDSDYGDFVSIDKSDAHDSLKRAGEFIEKTEKIQTEFLEDFT